MSEVTQLLDAAATGDSQAAAQLLPLVYEELRRLAAARLAAERPGNTLDATGLVHEAYLRLTGSDADRRSWANRGHFFAAAAESIRRILVESARRKRALKHGGGYHHVDVDSVPVPCTVPQEDTLMLSEALDRLAAVEPRKAELVKLRYYAGLTIEETASALGISPATAKRDWVYSRAWLFREISASNDLFSDNS